MSRDSKVPARQASLSPPSPAEEIPASRHDAAAPTRAAAFLAVLHVVAP